MDLDLMKLSLILCNSGMKNINKVHLGFLTLATFPCMLFC